MGSSCPGICIFGGYRSLVRVSVTCPQLVLVVESDTFKDVRVHLVTIVFWEVLVHSSTMIFESDTFKYVRVHLVTTVWVQLSTMIFFEWVGVFLFESDTLYWVGSFGHNCLWDVSIGLGNISSYWKCSTWDKNLAFELGSQKNVDIWNKILKYGIVSWVLDLGLLGWARRIFYNLVFDFGDVTPLWNVW